MNSFFLFDIYVYVVLIINVDNVLKPKKKKGAATMIRIITYIYKL